MEKPSQTAWKIVPLKVVPLIEVLLYKVRTFTVSVPHQGPRFAGTWRQVGPATLIASLLRYGCLLVTSQNACDPSLILASSSVLGSFESAEIDSGPE
jgi:hypothetical protein